MSEERLIEFQNFIIDFKKWVREPDNISAPSEDIEKRLRKRILFRNKLIQDPRFLTFAEACIETEDELRGLCNMFYDGVQAVRKGVDYYEGVVDIDSFSFFLPCWDIEPLVGDQNIQVQAMLAALKIAGVAEDNIVIRVEDLPKRSGLAEAFNRAYSFLQGTVIIEQPVSIIPHLVAMPRIKDPLLVLKRLWERDFTIDDTLACKKIGQGYNLSLSRDNEQLNNVLCCLLPDSRQRQVPKISITAAPTLDQDYQVCGFGSVGIYLPNQPTHLIYTFWLGDREWQAHYSTVSEGNSVAELVKIYGYNNLARTVVFDLDNRKDLANLSQALGDRLPLEIDLSASVARLMAAGGSDGLLLTDDYIENHPLVRPL